MQQIQTTAWSESAVHAFADLGLLSCQTVNYFICQKRSKCSRFKPQRGLNLLYMLSLILDCWAVRPLIISSAKSAANAADSNHSVVWLNLLYMLSLILDCWAVRPLIISSAKKRSKCLCFESAVHAFADLELLSCYYHHFICQKRRKCSRFKPQRGLTESAVHAFADLGLLSCQTVNYFICQKAQQMPVFWICCTCFRWSWTAELSLPSFHLP